MGGGGGIETVATIEDRSRTTIHSDDDDAMNQCSLADGSNDLQLFLAFISTLVLDLAAHKNQLPQQNADAAAGHIGTLCNVNVLTSALLDGSIASNCVHSTTAM